MNRELTLGSLFDGSGGFPLAGVMAGIQPVWSSEIEPFPIRVTTRRFPYMKHYGNICDMNGAEIEPVDIITFGSPCQDLSLAGKRNGLDGSRSSLFFEAIRVIKEMREATNGEYPRWIVWENVPGAMSSCKGQDFRTVLDEICKIKDETVSVPMPEKKWETAGEIMGEDYSVAYRILDAQFWGVPQRRRRIFLVADFGGTSAGKVLFESESLFGNFAKERGSRQGTAADAEKGTGAAGGIVLNDQGGSRMDVTENITSTLRAEAHHPPCVMESAGFCTEHSSKSRSIGYEEENSPTLRAGVVPAAVTLNQRQMGLTVSDNLANTLTETDYKGTQVVAQEVYENHSQDTRYKGPLDVAQTVSATYGKGGNNQPFVVSENEPTTLKIRGGCIGGGKGVLCQYNKSATLGCNNDQTVFVPKTYGICSDGSNSMKSDNPNSGIYEANTARTLDGNGGNPGCHQGGMAIVCVDQGGGKSNCNISKNKAPTLSCTHGGEPVICLQGSMIGRKDKNGPQGSGINKDVSFTLNTADKHCVYALDRASYNQGKNAQFDISIKDDETAQTVVAKGPGAIASFYSLSPQRCAAAEGGFCEAKVMKMKAESQCFRDDDVSNTLVNGTNPGYQNGIVEPQYTVRRLTPLECCRLQGFPDYWCDGLETENPTEEDISYWTEVFETHRKAIGKSSKPKSRNQIIKWLKNPYSDSAMYAMWGNGVALPCVYYVLNGIANIIE